MPRHRSLYACAAWLSLALVLLGCTEERRRRAGSGGPITEDGVGVGIVVSNPWAKCQGTEPMPDGTCCPSGQSWNGGACAVTGLASCTAGSPADRCLPPHCTEESGEPAVGCGSGGEADGPAPCRVNAVSCSNPADGCPPGFYGPNCGVAAGSRFVALQAAEAAVVDDPPAPAESADNCQPVAAIAAPPEPIDPSICLEDGGPPFCEPVPTGDFACPTGFLLDGQTSCKPDPARCTSAPYGGPVPTDSLYVSASAAAGGNGSAAAPFVTLAAALAVAKPDQTIAVDKGTYAGPFANKVPVKIRGKCAHEVVLTSASKDVPMWTWSSGKLELSDLRLTGEERAIAAVGGELTLQRVAVESARYIGLHVTKGTAAELVDVVVRDTRPQANGGHGRGIWLESGATLSLSGGAVLSNRTAGITVSDLDTEVSLFSTVVANTAAQESDNKGGRGIVVSDGAALTLTDVQVLANLSSGIACYGAGEVELTSVAIVGTKPEPATGAEGYGLLVSGSQVNAQGVLAQANTTAGIFVTGKLSELVLTGASVLATAANNNGSGVGLQVESGASVIAEALEVSDNVEYGVLVSGAQTSLDVSQALVTNTAGRNTDGGAGYGIWCQDGAACVLGQTRVHNNHTVSVTAAGNATSISLTEVTISQTLSQQEDLGRGVGLQVVEGASCLALTVLVHGSRTAGLWVSDPGPVELDGLQVVATQAQESDGWGGRGIHWVNTVPTAEQQHVIQNSVLRDNRDHQLYLEGDSLLLDNVQMANTQADSAGDSGHAIQVRNGGQIDGYGLVLTDHRTAAVFARDEGTAVKLEGGCILRTEPRQADGAYGRGAVVESGASLELAQMRLSGHRGVSVSAASLPGGAAGTVSQLVLQDVVIDGTLPGASGGDLTARGIESHDSKVEVLGLRIHDAAGAAVALYGNGGVGTTTILRDVHLTHAGGATSAVGLVADDAGTVVLRRLRTAGPFAVHLEIRGETQLYGGHVGLQQTTPAATGLGLLCAQQATCQLAVSQLAGSFQAAVLALSVGTTVKLTGSTVGRDGDSQVAKYGAVVLDGAALEAAACAWHGASVAAVASDAGGVSLVGSVLYQLATATQPADGLRLTSGASGQFTAGQIAGFGRCGALTVDSSSLALTQSVVADNRFGIGQMLNGAYTVLASWLDGNQNQLATGTFVLPSLPAKPKATERAPAFTL